MSKHFSVPNIKSNNNYKHDGKKITENKNFRKTKGYIVQVVFFAVRKKVLRKVNHFKVLEKRN